MKLRRIIPRILVAAIISGTVTIISNILISLIFGASVVGTVIIALIGMISFSICLVYFLHIYHASGEGDVWEDYPEVYPGVLKDIPKIAKKELPTFIVVASLSATVLILHVISRQLNVGILKYVISVFKPIASRSYAYSGKLLFHALEYLIGAFSNCVAYVVTFALFRWKWRRFM